jgi:hypothetical protein
MALPLPVERFFLAARQTYCPDTPDLLPKTAYPRSIFGPKNSFNPFPWPRSLFAGLVSSLLYLLRNPN